MSKLRRLGVLVPVFSLRRDNDLGVGDTKAMKEMVDWAAAHREMSHADHDTGSEADPHAHH